MKKILYSIIITLTLSLTPSWAQINSPKHVQAELLSEVTSIKPDKPFWVGLLLEMENDWHTYWENPGENGLATSLEWDLPQDFQVSEIQFPAPQRFEFEGLVSYGYSDHILLLAQIKPPINLAIGEPITLSTTAHWLECQNVCIPGSQKFNLTLPVERTIPLLNIQNQPLFKATRHALPRTTHLWETTPTFHQGQYGILIQPKKKSLPKPSSKTYFFPKTNHIQASSPQTFTKLDKGSYFLTLALKGNEVPESIEGVLYNPEGWLPNGEVKYLQVTGANQAALPGPSTSIDLPLPMALLFAFVGGLILNLMPCVFPILSIKILGFVQQAGKNTKKIKLHGLFFVLGVIISFWILSGLLLFLRSSGEQLGWGFQLQSPIFLVFLCALLLLLALNLAGLFEIGISFMFISNKASSQGYLTSFSSGILTTVLATPCTAPFMGSALGFALVQPPLYAIYIFTALALGMGLPYLLLSLFPALLKFLPRPGAWMETFKQAMAFPLLATVIWLLWVLAQQTSLNALIIVLFALLVLSLAAWVYGRFVTSVASAKSKKTGVFLSLLLGVLALSMGYETASRTYHKIPSPADQNAYGGLKIQPYSRELLESLRAHNKAVYLDFTAAWCLTCQTNKKLVFDSPEVIKAFKDKEINILIGNWTRYDPEITKALASYGCSGVPLNILYPPQATAKPIILPKILTPPLILNILHSWK